MCLIRSTKAPKSLKKHGIAYKELSEWNGDLVAPYQGTTYQLNRWYKATGRIRDGVGFYLFKRPQKYLEVYVVEYYVPLTVGKFNNKSCMTSRYMRVLGEYKPGHKYKISSPPTKKDIIDLGK